MEKELNQLVDKIKTLAGDSLKSVVLYGSAASGEFHQKHSDLNVLCVLSSLDVRALERLNPAAAWWTRRGHPAPLVFSLEELRRSADVFAIEFLDIKMHHRVLTGEDIFAELEVPMSLHRVQVERELRTNLVKLRQHYLAASRDNKAVLGLMTASVSSFASLFRHALIALGDSMPELTPRRKREIIDRLAGLLGFDAGGFHAVLDVREGKLRPGSVDVPSTFSRYLQAIENVTTVIDERLRDQ